MLSYDEKRLDANTLLYHRRLHVLSSAHYGTLAAATHTPSVRQPLNPWRRKAT